MKLKIVEALAYLMISFIILIFIDIIWVNYEIYMYGEATSDWFDFIISVILSISLTLNFFEINSSKGWRNLKESLNIVDLSNQELLRLGSEFQTYNEMIQKEWFKRHEMNFPYTLDIEGNIVHCILKEVVSDDHCDRLILEQANKLRRKLNTSKQRTSWFHSLIIILIY